MLYARHQRDGLPLRERIFSSVDSLGRLGCAMPSLANSSLNFRPLRALMEKMLGISAKRSLPHYASERFDHWFQRHSVTALPERRNGSAIRDSRYNRGKVILWDDTFVRYHEPHIGIAAVKVLEALGFEVSLVKKRRCCGRPAFSQGNLDAAANLGKHNINLLNSADSQLSTNPPSPSYGAASNSQLSPTPILFLEPSCWSMFVEDYRELKIENADNVAKRCFLFEKFVDDLLAQEPDALRFDNRPATIAIIRIATPNRS
jgi:Fe-S oxidoreductase